MKKVIAAIAIAASILYACHKGVPLPGPTDPGPVPTPTPVVDWTPAWPFGVVYCCNNNPGWPLVTHQQLQEMRKAGGTLTHVRTGPYEAGSEDAAATTISKLIDTVGFANTLGISVEVDLVDGWALVNRVNLWHDSCSVTQGPPPQRYIDHITEVVNATKGFQVTYQLGNEMYRCTPTLPWLQGLYNAAKAAGAGRVGSDDARVGDYLTVHGFSPTSNGAILNETDNQEHTPAQWVDLYQASKKRGGYIMVWFGPSDDAQRAAILAALRHVDDGQVSDCFVPQSEDPGWLPPSPPNGNAEMKDIVLAARAEVPEMCGTTGFDQLLPQLDRVAGRLRLRGVCADRSRDSVFVRNSRGKFEEYHAVSFATGCWANNPADLPKNIWTYAG